jgi:hypothetical protein
MSASQPAALPAGRRSESLESAVRMPQLAGHHPAPHTLTLDPDSSPRSTLCLIHHSDAAPATGERPVTESQRRSQSVPSLIIHPCQSPRLTFVTPRRCLSPFMGRHPPAVAAQTPRYRRCTCPCTRSRAPPQDSSDLAVTEMNARCKRLVPLLAKVQRLKRVAADVPREATGADLVPGGTGPRLRLLQQQARRGLTTSHPDHKEKSIVISVRGTPRYRLP